MITCSVICAISLPIALSHDRDNDNNHEENDVDDVDVEDVDVDDVDVEDVDVDDVDVDEVEPVVEAKCRRDRDNDDD